MLHLFNLLVLLRAVWAQSTAINVAQVPQCARDCLSNSTSVATACTSLDVACLCKSSEFVSTFYCCLSTQCNRDEQTTAILFNQQQCAAVNTTAPDFVGCSPLKATSSGSGTRSATTVTPGNGGPYSTIASIFSELATFSVTNQVTATFAGQSLLTGSCTAPLFALVSASNDARLFPQVGCAPSRQECCPFDVNTNVVITRCPQDYFTTANGCCPSGYQVYSRAVGAETPCYSSASTILIPATTPSLSGLTIITDHVFSKKYTLGEAKPNTLSPGGIAGITIAAVAFVAITAVVLWWIRCRKRAQLIEAEKVGATFPPQEPVLPPQVDAASPQELASPEVPGFRSPMGNFWPRGGFASPRFEHEKPLPNVRSIAPQELPGSTYINEHHPALTGSDTATELSAVEFIPRTPARSPVTSATGSPPSTPVPGDHERAISPEIVSPIGSPRIPRATTTQSVVSDRD